MTTEEIQNHLKLMEKFNEERYRKSLRELEESIDFTICPLVIVLKQNQYEIANYTKLGFSKLNKMMKNLEPFVTKEEFKKNFHSEDNFIDGWDAWVHLWTMWTIQATIIIGRKENEIHEFVLRLSTARSKLKFDEPNE